MITWVTGDVVRQIRGLSTDPKPTDATLAVKDAIIPNGSTFLEMDTGDVYMFDSENQRWLKI